LEEISKISERASQAVCRPAFMCAVALLVVNDHVLKASGIAPGWFTGKLSDAAGLFFFPVLLSVVAIYLSDPDRWSTVRRISAAAAAVTIGVFGLLNLAPPVAAGLSEFWGTHTVDPTDLVCLPFAVAGHVWFVRHLRRSGRPSTRRVLRYAMIGFAAAASLATSQAPAPPVEIVNEKDPSLDFVSSSATFYYTGPDSDLRRIQVDGENDVQIGPADHQLESTSRGGSHIAMDTPNGPAVYDVDNSKLEHLPGFSDDIGGAVLSPEGDHVAVLDMEDRSGLFSSYELVYSLHVVSTDSLENQTLRKEIESTPLINGWSSDGSQLYFDEDASAREELERYELGSGAWTTLEYSDVSGSDLYDEKSSNPETCSDGDRSLELDERWDDGDLSEYDGLYVVDDEGNSERIVEVEFEEEPDEDENYEPPIEEKFFVDGCKYVVFTVERQDAIRVVGVDSKVVGTVAKSREPWLPPGKE